jgi:chaperone modulatory protein CbpM
MTDREWVIEGELLDETASLRLDEFCACLRVEQQWIGELVAIGALEPSGGFEPSEWLFPLRELRRARMMTRLVDELEVDPHGAAIIADLLEERQQLVRQLRRRVV